MMLKFVRFAMSQPVWTAFDAKDSSTWPVLKQPTKGSKVWPPPESFLLVYGRKNGERKNGYHKAIYLGNGKFCWPIEHVVAWSPGPIAKDDVDANGFPVVWHKRDASEPPGSIDVLVLCTFLTKQLHWSVSRFNEAKKEWSIEKKQASVEFWAEIPETPGEAKTLF